MKPMLVGVDMTRNGVFFVTFDGWAGVFVTFIYTPLNLYDRSLIGFYVNCTVSLGLLLLHNDKYYTNK